MSTRAVLSVSLTLTDPDTRLPLSRRSPTRPQSLHTRPQSPVVTVATAMATVPDTVALATVLDTATLATEETSAMAAILVMAPATAAMAAALATVVLSATARATT